MKSALFYLKCLNFPIFINFLEIFIEPYKEHLKLYHEGEFCKNDIFVIFSITAPLRRATKLIPGFADLPYEERLRNLNLPSMSYRLSRGDMIETYKWFHGSYTSSYSPISAATRSITRGHNFKLRKPTCNLDLRKHFFALRI